MTEGQKDGILIYKVGYLIYTLETHCPPPTTTTPFRSAYNILPLFGHIGRIFGQDRVGGRFIKKDNYKSRLFTQP